MGVAEKVRDAGAALYGSLDDLGLASYSAQLAAGVLASRPRFTAQLVDAINRGGPAFADQLVDAMIAQLGNESRL